ncbi:hypothetical protein NW754_007201 [Fusarium falciforme]|nr:hypothetical protein NW754_007201 [Fusarium falciforme]
MATRQRTSTTVVVEKPSAKVTLEPQQQQPQFPDIKTIKDAIPAHCFQPSLFTSFYYVFRDFAMVATLVWAALTYIPAIPDQRLRVAAWMVYGFVQGLVCTGVLDPGPRVRPRCFLSLTASSTTSSDGSSTPSSWCPTSRGSTLTTATTASPATWTSTWPLCPPPSPRSTASLPAST